MRTTERELRDITGQAPLDRGHGGSGTYPRSVARKLRRHRIAYIVIGDRVQTHGYYL